VSDKRIFEHLDRAAKFQPSATAIVESVTSADATKAQFALSVAKRLAEAKRETSEPVSLKAYPLAN
jgi:hypothetical protein